MIMLLVTYKCKPQMTAAFVKTIREEGLDKKCQADPGNLMYRYFFPVEGGDEVILVEKWESEALAKEHLKAPHMDRIRELKDIYVNETTMQMSQIL